MAALSRSEPPSKQAQKHSDIIPFPKPGWSVGIRVPGLTAPLMPGNAQPWPQLLSLLVWAHSAHQITSCLEAAAPESRAGRRTVVPPPHWVTQPHAPGTGPARDRHHLRHLPGSALRRGSLLGTAQPPRCFSLRLSWGCPDVPAPPPPQPRPPLLPAGRWLAGRWSGSVPRLLPLSQRRARTPSEAAQRSHGIKTTGHSSMPGCVTQRDHSW